VGLDTIPLFVRAGAVLPLSVGARRAVPGAEAARDLALYPAPGAFAGVSLSYDDDGDSAAALAGDHCLMRIAFSGDGQGLSLALTRSGQSAPPSVPLRLVLPGTEAREVTVNGRPSRPGDDLSWPR
jgi:alpha-glucosidase